jgi:hypothetical protein
MFEGHDNATAAPRCLETEYNLPFILNALWIDDAEIGAYLNSTYGMPVRIAAFTSTNVTGSPAEADFRWSVDNGPENHLFARDLNIDPSAGRYISKWIWTHAGGITYLDLDKTLFTSSYEQQVAPGELYPPMLYREAVPSSPYIGTVVLHQNVDATGKIFRFNDYMCEEPADEGS